MISKGYEPIGGMKMQQTIGSNTYFQTMYKKPEQDMSELLAKFGISTPNAPITPDPTHGLPAVETYTTPVIDVLNDIPQLIHAIKVEPKVDKRKKIK